MKAINHVNGPARVIAGPGSGKTFTIIQRILNLITNHQIYPDKILTITFTRAAALEMQSRYLKESENNPTLRSLKEQPHFGTFHGLCFAILKESGLISQFHLAKETDKRKIIEIILNNRAIEGADQYDNISGMLDTISRKKNFCKIGRVPLRLSKEEFDHIYLEYEDMMKQQKLLDFDDMILLCLSHLRRDQKLLKMWKERFSHILVDEFQDINEVQYLVVRLLASGSENLFVVGDDDQSIYGFRGSAPGIMRKFTDDFKGAAELTLSENYRSGSNIVELADRMIRRNKNRFLKSPVPMHSGGKVCLQLVITRQEEENRILNDIKMLSEEVLNDSALIVRTNAEVAHYRALIKKQGIALCEKTIQNENPFQSFVANDILAFLQFCYEGNKRTDFLKIMNKPNMFLSRQALTEENITEKNMLAYYENNREMSGKISALFHHFRVASKLSPSLAVRYFRKIMGYDRYLSENRSPEESSMLLKTAEQLQGLLGQMRNGEKTADFFGRMQYEYDNEKKTGAERKGISVLTMHGAKGLEFSCVFLPDLNEGVIPGKNCKTEEEIEEERRLLYVAITRAKNSLFLYYTKERNRKITRFLDGLIPHHR